MRVKLKNKDYGDVGELDGFNPKALPQAIVLNGSAVFLGVTDPTMPEGEQVYYVSVSSANAYSPGFVTFQSEMAGVTN